MSNVGKFIVYYDRAQCDVKILSIVLCETEKNNMYSFCAYRRDKYCYTAKDNNNYELFDDLEVARARLAPNETSENI